jgi:hypothetical protein
MSNHSQSYFRIICLLLTFHLVALNTCEKFYLNLLTQSTISKDFDIEEDTDSKSKTNESDSFIDDYLVEEIPAFWNNSEYYFIENNNPIASNFSISTLLQGIYEIQIPPPRA